ncbi:MAG: 7-carboxy-7-deazaguanine synthase QueE [Bacteroidia bacterium]
MMKLPVMEHFYTIQGEGAFTGYAAYFIRLAGCDVGCVWCDVKESWDTEGYARYSIREMLKWVKDSQANRVVITGGEPAMYDLTELCEVFRKEQIFVHIETSAAHPIKGRFNWICISPKKFKFPIPHEMKRADELKIVVFNPSDFNWALQWAKECDSHCKKYLQPEWEKQDELLPSIINFVKKYPDWQISLQSHKYMNIP